MLAPLTDCNAPIIEEFRANAGKVDGWKSPLLLTTTGVKSGELRISLFAYQQGTVR